MNNHEIGALYKELHGYLFTLIQGRLFEGCPTDYAYDCLNEVFIIAIHKKDDPKFQSNPKQWLVKTAKFVVDNFNRKHVNRLRFHYSYYDMHTIPSKNDMIEDLAFKMAIEDHIMDKIKTELTAEDRVIYIMRFEELRELEDIAAELCMRKGTVSVRITRIKNRITKLIKKYTSEDI